MKNVILYTRISTDEDKQIYSLNHQMAVLRKYCEIKGYNVLEFYREEHSAKDFNRPKFNELLSFVKANKKNVDMVLFTKWDRYSRNQHEALNFLKIFEHFGVEVNAVEQPLDMSNPDNKILLSIYLIMPEIENDKISERTTVGMRRARREGYWVSTAPYGYSNFQIDKKHHTIKPNEKAHFVLEAFQEVGKGIQSVESIRLQMRKQGLALAKQSFLNMLRNPVYIGLIRLAEYKKEPESIVKGVHQPIINDDLFYRVQEFMSGRRRGHTIPSHKNLNFPLRNFLQCGDCGENLTASMSKGRNGTRYPYYHCRKSCKTRIPANSANEYFISLLQSLNVEEAIMLTFAEMLKDSFGENEKQRKYKLAEIGREIEQLDSRIVSAENRLLANDIAIETFNNIVTRLNSQKMDLNMDGQLLTGRQESPVNYFAMAKTVLSSLDSLYQSLDYDLKRVFIVSIFPDKVKISKNECRTSSQNVVVQYLSSNTKALQIGKKKKATKNGGLSLMALPAGLEPATL